MKRVSLFEVVAFFGLAALIGAWIEDWIEYYLHFDFQDYTGAVTGIYFSLLLLAGIAWFRILNKLYQILK